MHFAAGGRKGAPELNIEVQIARSRPEDGRAAYRQIYHVPVPDGARWTAMDLLDYIQRRMDGSLGYFRHSACGRGLCRRCAARINGNVGYLCAHIIEDDRPLVLEPISEASRIRDLVCR